MAYRLVLLITISFLYGWHPQAQAVDCFPVYGNWCGINYPEPGHYPAPVDVFDTVCMRHDLCLQYPNYRQVCDENFINELGELRKRYGSLPRPLEWADMAIRIKAGHSPLTAMPEPTPMDAFGLLFMATKPCQ